MKSPWKLLLALAIFALAMVAPQSGPASPAEAQTPSPYCSGVTYNAQYCALATQYCATATYNAALCAQYGGTGVGTGTSIYCQAATYNASNCALATQYCAAATYNAALCTQYGGTATGTGTSIYCQAATYNATLCAQVTGTGTNIYCQAGTYNATLCAQSTGTTGNSIYCQPATYNATLCAQTASTGNSIYCQAANYNAALCAQYTSAQPTEVVVKSNQAGLDCGGSATITVQVRPLAGGVIPDGTPVTLTASQGTINPPTLLTASGFAQAVYTAPRVGTGSVTITGTSGTINGSANIALNCIPIVPTPFVVPVQVPQLPPVFTAPPQVLPSPGSIQPPNTGDGGLLPSE